MLSQKLAEELNQQIKIEIQAAYFYLSAYAYFSSKSLDGFSSWCMIQSQEEMQHALKIHTYLLDQGNSPTLLQIDQPVNEFSSFVEAFELALKNEQDLGSRFNELSELARDEKDNATLSFLTWFVDEQVEEVALVSSILDKLKLIGEDGHGILLLNNELGKRRLEAE